MDKHPLIHGYRPKIGVAVLATDPKVYHEARVKMARDHVMHIRNRATDPWADASGDIRTLDGPLRSYYKDLIEAEYHVFVNDMEISHEDAKRWNDEVELFRFWSSDVQQVWQGWLCARLGFLPRNSTW